MSASVTDAVSFEVRDANWDELPHRLKTMLDLPVVAEVGEASDDRGPVRFGGLLESVEMKGDEASQELVVWIEGSQVRIPKAKFVDAELCWGYVRVVFGTQFLSVSYYSRWSTSRKFEANPKDSADRSARARG